jgi:hypothetical protein
VSDTEFRVLRIQSTSLVIEKLPDGSTAVLDTRIGTVHSLNLSAAAAFEACRESCTVAGVARAMSELLNAPVSEDLAFAAVSELLAAGLVVQSSANQPAGQGSSRRSLLQSLAASSAVALPIVLSLSAAEQKAYAAAAGSGTPAIISITSDPTPVCPTSHDAYTFTLIGQYTNFNQATSQITMPSLAALTIGTVTVYSPTKLTVFVSGFSLYSVFGSGYAIVTTGSEVLDSPSFPFVC